MPVVDGKGQEVLKLAFESSRRGQHLQASLALPNGDKIADLEMGTPPALSGVRGVFSSVAASYTISPPPPVQLRVLGQAYGSYTVTSYMSCGFQGGGRWSRADGSGGAVIPEPAANTCCFC